MTSMERVLAALGGTSQSRPPFTMTLCLYGARLTNCPLPEYFMQPNRYVEGQMAVMDLCAPDILFGPFALTKEAEAFGCELTSVPKNAPNVKKPVGTYKEFLSRPMPDFSNSPGLLYLKESVRLLVDKVKGQVPVCGIVTAPIDLPAEVMGIDTWISTLISQPDMAREVLAVATKHFVNLANAHLADGATFIAVPMVFNSPRFLYKKLIDTIIMPTIVSAFSQVKGPIVFHHAGSPLVPLIKEYTSLPNIVGFVFDHRDSLVEARAALSKGTLILGNLLGPTLASVPTDFIRAKVNAMLDDRTNDQNYIFATSAADVPFDTPPERIVAIADTIRSWERTW